MNDEADKTTSDPRLGIGGNNPPLPKMIIADQNFAKTVEAYIDDEYAEMPRTIEELEAAAAEFGEDFEDEAEFGKAAALYKRMKDFGARVEKARVTEVEGYLRGQQAVNGRMFGWIERVVRRDRKSKPGIADKLYEKIDRFNQRKLAAERERLRKESEDRAREAEQARLKEETERREAEEKRLAAERARKPEKIEEKTAVAEEASTKASAAAVDAAITQGSADEAHIRTLNKPAEMVRTRHEAGAMTTMGTEPYAVVEDEQRLDKEKLWAFIPLAAKEQALRGWAKNTGYTQTMDGAKVGRRPKTQVR